MDGFSGKRALVTGGTRGLGFEIVSLLARGGATVLFTGTTDRSVSTALDQLADRGNVTGAAVDLRDRAAMTDLAGQGWDILINNAGVAGPIGPFHAASESDLTETLDINLTAATLAAHAVLPAMLDRGGTIVNISTGAAHRPIPNSLAYCVSKAGLAMLTRVLDAEYAGRGLRVFGFGPGVMRTDMHTEVRGSGHYDGVFPALDGVAPPKNAARAVAWLCTPAADGLKGRELSILDDDIRTPLGLPPHGG